MESSPLSIVFAVSAGVALAAATGFRAFLPVFALGLAARLGWTAIRPAESWIAGDLALIALGTATVLEFLADKIPVVDHALDTMATFIRPAAAWVVSFGVLTPLGQEWASGLATLLAGGAFGIHALKAKTRVGSTVTTFGVGNPVLSVFEDIIAFVLTLVGILAPLLALVFLGLLVWLAVSVFRRIGRVVRPAGASRPE